MSLNHDLVGVPSEPVRRSWTSKDALLYAVGCGAGHDDPLAELTLTTENSHGVSQQVLPTYGVLVASGGGGRKLGDFNPAMLVHGGQEVELAQPLPVEGEVEVTSVITSIEDKRSGALISSESRAVDADTREELVLSRSQIFIRGEGGFSEGQAGAASAATAAAQWALPDREPDLLAHLPTWPGQALVYRLSGDRNPLHSDPVFAQRGNFERPILHGLCTYGMSARALIAGLADGEVSALTAIGGRFSAPVTPGDTLTVRAWRTDGTDVLFQTLRGDGTVCFDRGTARVATTA
ncbi:MaoC/PaaZ C-terminal domain-containing protein [Ornithinimicrobium murale]|uniref:MaoC/PaaZ C-terminal domain-containing protein n=1 Tax=Ornithinimicrobium murale TaxID=1050153 RepID=UPI000E0D95C2|nr:MaoC/PaaZ C-terminal domain-containing protein [Ornithinimicrobium murale]